MDDIIQTIDLCYDLRLLAAEIADEVINLQAGDVVTHEDQRYRLVGIRRVYTRDDRLHLSMQVRKIEVRREE